MEGDVFTFIVGGQAGQGVRTAGAVAGSLFTDLGRRAFVMDDYPSLIQGGHNFSVISTSADQITSHYMTADLIVALDERSYGIHKEHMAKDGIMVYNSDLVKQGEGLGLPMTSEAKKYPRPNLRLGVTAAAVLAAAVGLDKDALKSLIEREYRRDLENNIAFATSIYDLASPKIGARFRLRRGDKKRTLLTGNEAIALGAVAGGLDLYFAYPMTPVTSLLHYLARHDQELGIVVVQPEDEIAVANMAIGAAFAGAKAMVATSGGGFALMEEAFSLAGMSEAPLLCVLGSRSGPSIGLPTYTEQADLRFALNQGHGDFARIVASPGSVEETFYLTAEMLNLVWRFQTPGIILVEKHMSEGRMTVDLEIERAKWAEPLRHQGGDYRRYLDTADGVSPLAFPPIEEVIKWNSYEHDERGITTEVPDVVVKMHDKRKRKLQAIVEALKDMHTVNSHGEQGPVIFTYGSTTMSVREALRAGGLEARVVQPIYLEPLPVWELEKYKGSYPIVVEQSSTGQFATLLREKAGIESRAIIKKYDGRPFEPSELARKIEEVI